MTSYKSVDDDTINLAKQCGWMKGFQAGVWVGFIVMGFLFWVTQ